MTNNTIAELFIFLGLPSFHPFLFLSSLHLILLPLNLSSFPLMYPFLYPLFLSSCSGNLVNSTSILCCVWFEQESWPMNDQESLSHSIRKTPLEFQLTTIASFQFSSSLLAKREKISVWNHLMHSFSFVTSSIYSGQKINLSFCYSYHHFRMILYFEEEEEEEAVREEKDKMFEREKKWKLFSRNQNESGHRVNLLNQEKERKNWEMTENQRRKNYAIDGGKMMTSLMSKWLIEWEKIFLIEGDSWHRLLITDFPFCIWISRLVVLNFSSTFLSQKSVPNIVLFWSLII